MSVNSYKLIHRKETSIVKFQTGICANSEAGFHNSVKNYKRKTIVFERKDDRFFCSLMNFDLMSRLFFFSEKKNSLTR